MAPSSSSLHGGFILLFSVIGLSTCLMRGNETDRLSLLTFKSLISNDPLKALDSWNETLHFCEWRGITCSRRHQRVTVLDLPSLKLAGSIAPHIGNLSFLRKVNLLGNEFTGEIPPEIGYLTRLQKLILYNNSLNGEIPTTLSNCSYLTLIGIAGNQLEGKIPVELCSLEKLQYLAVQDNYLNGIVPASIGNLSSLIILSAVDNALYGSIPYSLGQLEHNQLSASVPCLAKLHKLRNLDIAVNHLGTGGADDLNFLSSLVNATGLQVAFISGNHFGGRIPETISNFSTTLAIFSIENNQISGEIPSNVGNLVNMEAFDVANNQISGTIPRSIGKLQKIVKLFFSSNQLTGQVPSSIGNLTKLIELNLGSNFLQGKVPPSLGLLQDLVYLDLSINHLTGPLPIEIFSLSSLSIYLDLSRNNLSGILPNEVGNLRNLGSLYVSENHFSGTIPASLGTCVRLERLHMGGNQFQGAIPESIGSLRGLEKLDLSHNNLSGEIPRSLENLNLLLVLNLSYNHFEGPVPANGVFKNASAAFIMGNSKLCGGSVELHLPKCDLKESKRAYLKKLTLRLVVSIVFALLAVSLSALFVFLYWFKRNKRGPSSSSSTDRSLLSVSYHTLLKATDGFSEARLLGIGAFGSVYKGYIGEGEDQKIIAVKVLNLLRRGAIKSFLAECEALRNIRHRNLVKVLTACSGIDSSGNDFKALVYEFMVNGSLENWLRQTHLEESGANETPRNLSLQQRLNIAIDTASSLDYLHHQCECPIVHCDLKPSNILLDEEMVARVGDFGLAKFISRPIDELCTNQSSSHIYCGYYFSPKSHFPEYGLGSQVSTWGDVYSYGIVLLEMFTGKRPTDEMFSENLNLHEYVKKALSGEVEEIVDPSLLEGRQAVELRGEQNTRALGSTGSGRVIECLISVLRVGVDCSNERPKERMGISEVVAELNSIRNKLVARRRRS
ncbi:receptor kinase-like protein Xa21 [Punica granatum]|uniref:non-specific serine/threonine protein kinase n=1 Tax=Punica granatum TaxID=22663 RepID=A0A6P8CTI2_PUNGR|nr:receptor kinase-like protein Xa21 [Punica granatum]